MDYAQRSWIGASVEKAYHSLQSSKNLIHEYEGVEDFLEFETKKEGQKDSMGEKRWYAAKVQYNRVQPIRERLGADHVEYFVPEIISSLVFFRATNEYVGVFEQDFFSRIWVYRDPLTRNPSPIPDHEMEVFMFVCTSGKQGLTYLGDDKPEYHCGDLVRVTDGPFKGTEGHIIRIKKDRRLVVSIKGIAAVATTYIHPQFLETIEESPKRGIIQ